MPASCVWISQTNHPSRISSGGQRIQVFLEEICKQLEDIEEGYSKHVASITGDTSYDDVEKLIKRYNVKQDIWVMGISRAASEGIDLKCTSEVHLLESSWNQATQEQTITRAIRKMSHVIRDR